MRKPLIPISHRTPRRRITVEAKATKPEPVEPLKARDRVPPKRRR
jgi:hypothetical protein